MDTVRHDPPVRLINRLEGRRVGISLADGSRIDDCQLISAGYRGLENLWLYTNGADRFVPLAEVTDVWECPPAGSGRIE
ncbi:MAG: hypothetical protein ACRDV9_07295 [Acidimicrobiia bacterium]